MILKREVTRTEVINRVAIAIAAGYYLEIGIFDPARNYDLIKIDHKTGVDPRLKDVDRGILRMTSDEYFAHIYKVNSKRPRGLFNIVFIDGDHSHKQSYRDVVNAEKWLYKGGVIIMHDVNPLDAFKAMPVKPRDTAPWSGEVWRSFVLCRQDPAFRCCCIADDHGIGIIMRGENPNRLQLPYEFEWPDLHANRQEWLNFIDPADLEAWLNV